MGASTVFVILELANASPVSSDIPVQLLALRGGVVMLVMFLFATTIATNVVIASCPVNVNATMVSLGSIVNTLLVPETVPIMVFVLLLPAFLRTGRLQDQFLIPVMFQSLKEPLVLFDRLVFASMDGLVATVPLQSVLLVVIFLVALALFLVFANVLVVTMVTFATRRSVRPLSAPTVFLIWKTVNAIVMRVGQD